ncbi:MAG: hypothetical protein AB3X44_09740 [Leptothrix sp. (in: b-proteobacteria)]
MSTDADTAAIIAAVLKGVEELKAEIGSMREDVSKIGPMREDMSSMSRMLTAQQKKLDNLSSDVDAVNRTVRAIETLPVPYGRPKSFVSATEYHSVSNPVRVKQGYQG